jgi:hypothetical protein
MVVAALFDHRRLSVSSQGSRAAGLLTIFQV